MKIALQTRNVQSSLQSWLDNELEVRGIDAVIYTRYILSLLQQEIFYDYEEEEAVLNKLFEYRKSKQKSGRRRRGPSPSFGRHGMDPEKVKKLAAIECLLSASDEDCDIEGLVDELYKKLQESQRQQSENCQTVQQCSCVPACNSQSSSDSNTPQVLAEKYYAAFPALTASTEPQPSPGSQSDSSVTVVSVWHKHKLQLKKGSGQENGQAKRKGLQTSIKRRRPIRDITNKMPHFVSRAQSVPHEEPELLIKKGKMARSWPEKSSYIQPHRSNPGKKHSHFKTVNSFTRRNKPASEINNRIKLVDEEQLVEYTKVAVNVPNVRGSPEIEHFLSKTADGNPKNGLKNVVTEDVAWYTSPLDAMFDSRAGNVNRLYNRVRSDACSDKGEEDTMESNSQASARRLYERGNTTQAEFSVCDDIVGLGDFAPNQAHSSGMQLHIIDKDFDSGNHICSKLPVDETTKSSADEVASAAVDGKGLGLFEMTEALLCLQEEDLAEGISEMMQDSSEILNKGSLSSACIWSPAPSHSVAHSFLSNLPELGALNVDLNFGDFNFNFLQDFSTDSALNDIIEDHLLMSPNSIFLDCGKLFSCHTLSPTFRQPCIGTNPKINFFDKAVGSKKTTACDLGVFSIRTHESEEEHFDFNNLDLHDLRPSSIQQVYETLSQASNDFKLWDIDLQLPSDELWLHFQSKSPRILEFFLDGDDHSDDVHKSSDEFTVVKRERSLSLDSADLYGSPGKWSDTFNNHTASRDLGGSEKQSGSLQKNSVFHSEPTISLAGGSFFNHSHSESGFVEVRALPKSLKATLEKHEVKSSPTKHATNLHDDEDLLTSPKTHFRPIRPDDLTIDCTAGAEGLEDLEDQYWIPEVNVTSQPFPGGCKLLGEEFHTYRAPVEELTTEETFAPKFKKIHPDKYSQTDLDAEHEEHEQVQSDIEVSSLLFGMNEFGLQSTESKESIASKDHISRKTSPEETHGFFNSSSFLFGLLPCSTLSSEESSRCASRNISDINNTSKPSENVNLDAPDFSRDIFHTASHKWANFGKPVDSNENIWSSVTSSLANKMSSSTSGTLQIPIKLENRTEHTELEEKTMSADDGIDDILETVTKDRWSQQAVAENNLFSLSDAEVAQKSNAADSDFSLGHMKNFFMNETADESSGFWQSPGEEQHIANDGCRKASIWSIGDEVIQLSTDNPNFDEIAEEGEHVLFGYGTDYDSQERGRVECKKLHQSGIWEYCQESESTIGVGSTSKLGEKLERQWSLQEVEWKDSGELGGSESLMTRFGKWDPTFAVTGSVESSFKNTWLAEQRMLFDDKSSDGWLDSKVDLVVASKCSPWTKQSDYSVGQSVYRKEGVWMEKCLAFKGGTAESNVYITSDDDDIFKRDHRPGKCEKEMRYSPEHEEFCVGSVEQMKLELKQEQMQLMHDIDSLRNDELKPKTAAGQRVDVGGNGPISVFLTSQDNVGMTAIGRKKKDHVQPDYDDEDEENLSWESQEDVEGDELLGSLEAVLHIPKDKLIFSTDLEEEWKSNSKSFEVQVPRHRQQRTSKDLSKRPCSFFLEGSCRRADCKFSHNISRITCRFWEEGSCFKGITCPFLHGYVGDDEHTYSGSGTPSSINTDGAVFELEMDSKCDKGSSSSSSTPQEAEATERSEELQQKSEQLNLKASIERKKLGRFSTSRYKSSKSHSKSAPIDIQSVK